LPCLDDVVVINDDGVSSDSNKKQRKSDEIGSADQAGAVEQPRQTQ
jgi:hypothetical protein